MAESPNKDTAQSGPESLSGQGQFAIHKIYVKDISFETPNSPSIFRVEWKPDLDIQLFTDASRLDVGLYEVIVRITVTVKIKDKTAFLAEVNQAGIFGIGELQEDRLKHVLSSFCPNILFPYARETISDLVNRGGFPQLLLAPVNFDAMYAKHLQEAQSSGAQPTEPSAA
uniref:Protein-export protein SecB n=1 Tax=Candidatus Kentrum sp. TUN TaxID=2126343 RepID=A0A451AMJ4_9GAMM|nr:MAG: preprotein translocase subunit SecB [Candidatus Kentron sp. TUN]VFK59798.1 MAG: preprotein translocase subunit SecB [Candidatus Kentron sp. TUN]VFK67261.1 MAG: preprotein translocase subunit SecB [Candidatus Kentron sp. TUN]